MDLLHPIPCLQALPSHLKNSHWTSSKVETEDAVDLRKDSGYASPSSYEDSTPSLTGWPQEVPGVVVPATQRAIVTPEMGKELNLVVKEIPVQVPAPGEVIVRIFYSGICRSFDFKDASFSIGPQPGYPQHNHIAGHEGIGRIVKSHDSSLLGRAVGIRYLGSSCGWCTYCLRGLFTSCPFQINVPRHVHGTFQTYMTIPTTCLVYLPEVFMNADIDLALYATALCSGSTALMSLRAAKVKPGDVVVVVGVAGAIGHMTGAIAKHVLRARVIGIDVRFKVEPLPHGYSDYSDILLSAVEAVDSHSWSEFQARLLDACELLRHDKSLQRKAEAVIIASSSFSAFQQLDDYVCDGGRIVCVGVPKGLNMLQVPLHCIVERNLLVTGTLMGGHGEALEVMEYIRTGVVRPHITKVDLEDIPYQMQKLVDCKTVGKVVACISDSAFEITESS
ncbi:GroES-like protein [Penicillium nucicola]|uniref:GroES-like protein n=1 Tax=Penicillium nucicola TaxID=1850975 RepID=UPI0025455509|nr:GroES-like protein [Penicillium nucicola]KAJ5748416.1 GroES-like protein [Penicillium nucicola]